jgi:hypothetical protein
MICIRIESNTHLSVIGDARIISPDHPLADSLCPVCDEPVDMRPVTLVFVGIDPETRAEGKQWCNGAAVMVHTDCAGVDTPAKLCLYQCPAHHGVDVHTPDCPELEDDTDREICVGCERDIINGLRARGLVINIRGVD